MEQLPDFVAQGKSKKVTYLCKSLYSLKQSPFAWFGTFARAVEKLGVKHSKSDDFVFHKQSKRGNTMAIVYVDDIVITSSDTEGISSLKAFLPTQFNTKGLGKRKYFLGV